MSEKINPNSIEIQNFEKMLLENVDSKLIEETLQNAELVTKVYELKKLMNIAKKVSIEEYRRIQLQYLEIAHLI